MDTLAPSWPTGRSTPITSPENDNGFVRDSRIPQRRFQYAGFRWLAAASAKMTKSATEEFKRLAEAMPGAMAGLLMRVRAMGTALDETQQGRWQDVRNPGLP